MDSSGAPGPAGAGELSAEPEGLRRTARRAGMRSVRSSTLTTGISAAILLVALAGLVLRFWNSWPPTSPEEITLEVLWVSCLAVAAGLLRVAVVTRRDSRQHNQTLEALRESEVRFRSTADSAPAMIWMTDATGACTYVSKPWTDFTGRTLEEELGNGWTERIHPEDRARALKECTDAFRERRPFRTVYRLMRADGKYRDILDSGRARYEGDEYAGFVGSCMDISEHREAERARAELGAIVASSEDAIVGKSLDGVVTSWNLGAQGIFGYTAEEMIGRPITTLIPPERVDEEEQILERLRRGERVEHFETVRRRKDGTLIDVSVTVSPIKDATGRIIGASKIARDITERRRSEMAQRRNEQELSDFFDNATIGLHWAGPDGIIVRANRAELEMLGYTCEEYVGHHVAEFHADRAVIDDILRRLALGEVVRNAVARMRAKDGSVRDVVIDSSVLWQDGKFVHTRCFTRDVSDYRRAEAEVSDLREALEYTVEGIAKIGPDGTMRSVNPAYAAMYGQTPAELVGMDRRKIVHPDDVPVLEAAIQTMHAEGKAEVDLRGVRKDGSVFYERATLVATHTSDGKINGWYSFIKDVSQRKLSERQLRESFARQNELFRREKTLLRELNHRVRNNLAGLLGLVGLYERSGRGAAEIGQAIRGKVRAMKEVHDMIGRTHGTPVDLAMLVGRMAADRSPEEGSGRVLAQGPTVEVPPSQAVAMAMVLQELMTNARKYGALSVPGGKIAIVWSYDENAPERQLRLEWVESGGPVPDATPEADVGLNLIEGLAGAELQGRCSFSFEPTGLRFSLEALLEGGAVTRPVPAA